MDASIAQAPSGPENGAAPKLDEIVVTARKMEESLQRVPVSVVVVTGGEIEARSMQNLHDLGQTTPNFTYGETPQGGRGNGVLYMRGVGQSIKDPPVGVYIDGVYLGTTVGNDVELMDLERVEVLRGPQGTLFGKNTSGGAVNIVTRKPDASEGALSGRLQAAYGSRNRFDLLGSSNIPLITDRLAVQISGTRRTQDGYATRPDGTDLGDLNRWSGRVGLMWTPAQEFDALLSFDYASFDEHTTVQDLRFINPVGAAGFYNQVLDPDYDDTWITPGSFFDNFGTGPSLNRGDGWGTALTLNYHWDGATATSISSYRASRSIYAQDPDASPINILDYTRNTKFHQFSEELRLEGKSFGERLSWTVGAYYFDSVDGINATDTVILTALSAAFTNGANPYLFSYADLGQAHNTSYALFGQLNYQLTERLSATAGVRFSRDEFEGFSWRANGAQLGAGFFDHPVPDPFPATTGGHQEDTSPRFGLDYQWTPDIMTYVSAARGYKAGDYDTTTADFVRPEESWTYELGVRSEFLEHRLRLNATYFYTDYKDMQLGISGSQVGAGGQIEPFGLTGNIPGVRIRGAELEMTYKPMAGLTLSGSLGLIDPEYTELPHDDPRWANTAIADPNAAFPYTPKSSYALAIEFERHVIPGIGTVARLDYSHRGDIDYHIENTGPLHQNPTGLLGARLTFSVERSNVAISVFGTNLTDERYILGGYDDASIANAAPGLGLAVVNMAAPREYGVSAQWSF